VHKTHIKNLYIFYIAGTEKVNKSISAKVKVISGTCMRRQGLEYLPLVKRKAFEQKKDKE